MRSIGSEFLSVAVILSIPAGIVAAFPIGAFGFRAAEAVQQSAQAAFVWLSPENERLALKSARASWQEKGGGARRLRADLFTVVLPEEEKLSVLTVRDRSRPPLPPEIPCERTAFLPSLKAAPPLPIKPAKATEALAFPREELLMMH